MTKTFADVPTLANYLLNGYWTTEGYLPHHWDTSSSNVISVDISGLNGAEQTLAMEALTAWEQVANVTFSTQVGGADITFVDTETTPGQPTAGTSASWNASGHMLSARVDISTSWLNLDGGYEDGLTGPGSYGFQTYVHEIGHALGLGHMGPYNGEYTNEPYSDTGATGSIYSDDTWQWSIMSYNDQSNYDGSTAAFVLTPEMADIYAVQSIYGAPNTAPGNTTYDLSAGAMAHFGAPVAETIYDSGGTDTIDASGYSVNQTIDLTPGNWSSIGQFDNAPIINDVAIYLTTTIENAMGGNGNDTIIGNGVANSLNGAQGNDTIYGGLGNDNIHGGQGNDMIDGGPGADIMHGDLGDDVYVVDDPGDQVIELSGIGSGNDTVLSSINYVLPVNVENLTLTGTNPLSGVGNTLDNIINGNNGDNTLQGGQGNDTISGAMGNDFIRGGQGNDFIRGGQGNDTIMGDLGNDTIYGDKGNDTLTGGDGNDTFIFTPGFGNDTITDFTPGDGVVDVINLQGIAGFDSFADIQANATATNGGTDTLITIDASDTITLQHVAVGSLVADDFAFA